MRNISVKSVDYVLDSLKILADNPYALLWELVEDFKCNGHEISVKSSTQYQQVVIDRRYQHIGGNISITSQYGVTYKNPLDYVKDLLTDNLAKAAESPKEGLDFGSGSEKEIREAIANKASQKVFEDEIIRIYNPNEKGYKNLEIAAALLSAMTGKRYFVKETYFDYGQDWKWTTICSGDVQYLSPRDLENIVYADSAEEIGKAVDTILNKKYH